MGGRPERRSVGPDDPRDDIARRPRNRRLQPRWSTVLATTALVTAVRTTSAASPTVSSAEPLPLPARPPDSEAIAAGSGTQLRWDHRRFGVVDGAALVVGFATAGIATVIGPDENDPALWINDFDESVRDALRSSDYAIRRTARDASDVALGLTLTYPYFFDALVNAAWYRDSPDVALQLALIDTETLAVAVGVQQAVANLVGRERPYVRTCGTEELPANNVDCERSDRFRSFFSGHTSQTFAAATVTCVHHAYLPLQDGRLEWLPCVAGLSLATATGTFRIAADMHYATDVLTGAAIGAAIGWVVPMTYYGLGRKPSGSALHWTLVPTPSGVVAAGSF